MRIIHTKFLLEATGNDRKSKGDKGYDKDAETALASYHLQRIYRMFFH